jgi:hypothetical protein
VGRGEGRQGPRRQQAEQARHLGLPLCQARPIAVGVTGVVAGVAVFTVRLVLLSDGPRAVEDREGEG